MLLTSLIMHAQHQIGHTTIYFTDPDRGDREIQTEIYYPATTAGDDVAVATGSFPVIIFGHGFVMAWDSYANFWEEFVPKGYFMAFPRTEGGIPPDHGEFGMDLAFLTDAMQAENTSSGSLFFGKVTNKTAVMGHSMGGGSSFLAAEANPNITTLVNFAAAETDPSSTTAAANVTIPAVVFAGAEDGVAPPAENQIPMYNALASNCKTYIGILEGGHCYFANYNFNCSLGEMVPPPLPRDEMHEIIFNFLNPWLNYQLKGDYPSYLAFNDSLQNSDRITYEQDCDLTTAELTEKQHLDFYPNPVKDILYIDFSDQKNKEAIEITDATGRVIMNILVTEKSSQIDVSNLKPGLYFLKFKSENKTNTNKFIKL